MKEAILYQKLPQQKVRCQVCQRRCLIDNNQFGFCRTRVNKNGKLYTTIYGIVSSLNNDPIEKKPVFHFRPGTFCLSAGTFGCNFRCLFCQNWEISWANEQSASQGEKISPQQLVNLALKFHSAGIAITYNEPAIWLEYSLAVFKLAKKQKLYTVWVTNGYATPQTIDTIAPYLDVYRVDFKSFDDKFYQKLINVPRALPIFTTTKYLHDKYPNIPIECVTNIIPGWNDSPQTLSAIARWIKENLGELTVWHVTRFFPYAKLTNIPPTPPETLYQAREIGLKEGLKFVYIGNLPVEEEDDTFCPQCGTLAIQRDGYLTKVLAVDQNGHCSHCGANLNVKI